MQCARALEYQIVSQKLKCYIPVISRLWRDVSANYILYIFRQAEVNQHIARTHVIQKERNEETIKDLQQIQNDVLQLIEENELLKKQRRPSTSR